MFCYFHIMMKGSFIIIKKVGLFETKSFFPKYNIRKEVHSVYTPLLIN